ncbi:ABC transporter ATP-binding protein [Streptomyces sp. NPDC047108]|uniref:ABC transporter ATP-binding protein n=1 Tax=Streptomyces sp. NPDC047108 TaxID=3155025 RepID=UPI0033EDEC62
MTAAVLAEDVVKRYAGMRRPYAVDHLSFAIEPGEVVGLLGPNGAGKTTLTKLICGAAAPDSGRITVFGNDPNAHGGRAKRGIGVVHQSAPFDMMLSVLDNLRIAVAFKGLRWRRIHHRVEQLLAVFGLEESVSQLVFTLSGGQMRRLQVVRALLGDPPLLLLDEPTAGLDVGGRRQVWSVLDALRREHGTTVLWTSHYVEELERNCRWVLIVDQGRLVEQGAPADIAEKYGRHSAIVRPHPARDTVRLAELIGSCGLQVSAGEGLVEVSGDVRALLPTALMEAKAEGIDVVSTEFRAPSLEDAFVELVEKSE